MQALPGLLDMVEDAQLDRMLVSYACRALREITDETLPDESRQWRNWYAARGADTTERFRKFERERSLRGLVERHDSGLCALVQPLPAPLS
jgi:hypothetical protein